MSEATEKTAKRLGGWMTMAGESNKSMSARLGITAQAVRKILVGGHVPTVPVAVGIEKITDGAITCADWVDS